MKATCQRPLVDSHPAWFPSGGGATTVVDFRLLGPLTVSRDGVPVAIGPGKQRALLTCLLLDTGRPLAIDRLVTLLWDERPPTSAMANIRTYAARLRTALVDPGRPALGWKGVRPGIWFSPAPPNSTPAC